MKKFKLSEDLSIIIELEEIIGYVYLGEIYGINNANSPGYKLVEDFYNNEVIPFYWDMEDCSFDERIIINKSLFKRH
jgi:hypothetical protein